MADYDCEWCSANEVCKYSYRDTDCPLSRYEPKDSDRVKISNIVSDLRKIRDNMQHGEFDEKYQYAFLCIERALWEIEPDENELEEFNRLNKLGYL